MKNPNSTHAGLVTGSAVKTAEMIMKEFRREVLHIYSTIEIAHGVPVVFGLRGGRPVFLIPLPAAMEARTAEEIKSGIETALRQERCDGMASIYPISLAQTSPSQADGPHPVSGLLLLVQLGDDPHLSIVLPLIGRAGGCNRFGAPLSVQTQSVGAGAQLAP